MLFALFFCELIFQSGEQSHDRLIEILTGLLGADLVAEFNQGTAAVAPGEKRKSQVTEFSESKRQRGPVSFFFLLKEDPDDASLILKEDRDDTGDKRVRTTK